MERLTEDLNIIRSLPAQPTMTAEELQSEFDKAGNIIKNYLNNTLLPELDNIESDLQTYLDGQLQNFRTEFDEYKGTIDTAISDLSSDLETAKTNISTIQTDIRTLKTNTTNYIKSTEFRGTVTLDGYTGKTVRIGTYSLPSGYTLLGVLPRDNTAQDKIQASYSISNNIVYAQAQNLSNVSASSTLVCRVLAIKNSV